MHFVLAEDPESSRLQVLRSMRGFEAKYLSGGINVMKSSPSIAIAVLTITLATAGTFVAYCTEEWNEDETIHRLQNKLQT